jgi:predicted secreted protein
MYFRTFATAALGWLAVLPAYAQDIAVTVPMGPSVAVTGTASTKVQNDRMSATLLIEAEHAIASNAANEVNARMAKVLERAKALPGLEVKSAGYSTWQTWEKGRPSRWKVMQSVSLTSGDFAALAALVGKLQDEDGALVGAIGFTVAPETRRKAEDALMGEAIRAWQNRAETASKALGFASWRTGRVNVMTSDMAPPPRTDFAMRAQSAAAGAAPPVAVEGGTTELSVTVTGDALLDGGKPR